MNIKIVVVLSAILFMVGCARLNSIYRDEDISRKQGQIILVDSKQRAIVTSPKFSKPDENGKTWNTGFSLCAEPPPDVFSALATSIAGKASAAKTGDLAAELAISMSENASTIERTQTVNILRERMYRTCERYLSGAIGESEFIVQTARDQQAMVAVLAIEQLTGVQKSQATALTTTAKAATEGASTDVVMATDKAFTKYQVAKDLSDKKRAEANTSAPADKKCSELTEADPDAKKKLCEEATALEQKTKEAHDHYKALNDALAKMSAVSTESQGAFQSAALAGSAASQHIAESVVEIVKSIQEFDEVEMTCVVIFRAIADGTLWADEKNTELVNVCLDRVTAEIDMETSVKAVKAAENFERAALIREQYSEYIQFTEEAFTVVLRHLEDVDDKQSALTELFERADLDSKEFEYDIAQLTKASNDDEFLGTFTRLDQDVQARLAEAAREE